MSISYAVKRISRAAAVALFAAAVFASIVGGGSSPAGAAPALSVSPASNLDPNGAFVVVSGAGYRPNIQLFVMQCRATSADDHTCNSVGLRKVTTNAAGAFTANAMKVVANFGATNCLQTPCAVKTSAVADHADDRSEDRSATISFRAAPPATTAPPVTAAPTVTPQTTPPTTAPPATTMTAAPTTTTTEATTTTTEAEAEVDEGDGDGATAVSDETATADGSSDEGAAAASTGQTASGRDDDGGSSPVVPIVIVVALAGAGIGALVFLRSRKAAPEA